MAAQAFRGLIRRAALALVALVALLAAYPLAGWFGSSLPRNADWSEPETGITILVETNGTHTGIVVPVANAVKDWRATFPSASRPRREDGRLPTHLGIGWGEREVFLHVPTWADLEPGTALRVALRGGDALMRVSHYVHPRPGPNHRPVRLTRAQYEALAQAIEQSLVPPQTGETRAVLRGSYAPDAYYAARGKYTLAQTCNSWVGDTLAAGGIAMGRWTPFAGGVMKWIDPPGETS